MQVTVCAVGRLRAGPEKSLVDDFLLRFDKSGRQLGLGPATVIEVEDRKRGGPSAEAALLQRAAGKCDLVCALDERGKTMTSPQFAEHLANWRDAGRTHVGFMIGGADGLASELRDTADFSLSFGKMVWPHMLVRVMLAEQLYRAASILSGSPYHRA